MSVESVFFSTIEILCNIQQFIGQIFGPVRMSHFVSPVRRTPQLLQLERAIVYIQVCFDTLSGATSVVITINVLAWIEVMLLQKNVTRSNDLFCHHKRVQGAAVY